jgi:class I fructose-bisphosphate aldolase
MNTAAIEKNGKIFMLAYDQGMVHGPTDFNDINRDPNFIIKIGLEGNASCIALHYGIAKKFYNPNLRHTLPLILKLNAKSKLYSLNDRPALHANVEDAVKLGAVGVGMTIHPGVLTEAQQYEQFAQVRREAEKAGLITIIWCYARGPEIKSTGSVDVVAYAARIAAELGADVVKLKYTGDPESFSWAVKNAVGTKLIASGTDNFDGDYIEAVKNMMKSGAAGIAVGRKVWQDADPISMAKKVAEVIYS